VWGRILLGTRVPKGREWCDEAEHIKLSYRIGPGAHSPVCESILSLQLNDAIVCVDYAD
jgi:hypothetical protein